MGNAVIFEDWLKFGGYEDWIYIGPGAWSFRYGSNFVERLAAFSSGKIRVVEVRWPVKFMFEEQYAPGRYRMFSVMVEPSFLEGEVVWDNAQSQDVGMRTRSARSGGCSCNCASYTNNTVTISIECNCNPRTHSGKYEYEGHFEPLDFDYYPEEEEGEDPENPEEMDDYRQLNTKERRQLIKMVREGLGRYPKWYQKESNEKLK